MPASIRLDEADDDVGPAIMAAVRLLEHLERLADPGRHAQGRCAADRGPGAPRPAAGPASGRRSALVAVVGRDRALPSERRVIGSSPSRSRLSSRTLTVAAPRNPRIGWLVCFATSARTWSAVMPRACATRATWYSAASGLMSGSSPEAEVVTRSTGIGAFPFAARRSSTDFVIRSMSAFEVGPRLEPAGGASRRSRSARRRTVDPRSTSGRRTPGRSGSSRPRCR